MKDAHAQHQLGVVGGQDRQVGRGLVQLRCGCGGGGGCLRVGGGLGGRALLSRRRQRLPWRGSRFGRLAGINTSLFAPS